jgi:hypothetical protein
MIFVALGLIGFGVGDFVRWSSGRVEALHAVLAAISGAGSVMLVAALSGMGPEAVLLSGAIAFAVLLPWSTYDLLPRRRAKPEYALALVAVVLTVLVGLSGSADPVQGDLGSWYEGLGFGFTDDVSTEQFILGAGAFVFLLVTANRLVRFTLDAAEASLLKGEGKLRGGRVLGPMERLMVAAAVISGSLAGAGFVIAAKGLLRFREIRVGDQDKAEDLQQPGVDEITEYFLIGTFTSLLIAAALGLLVLAAR